MIVIQMLTNSEHIKGERERETITRQLEDFTQKLSLPVQVYLEESEEYQLYIVVLGELCKIQG